MGIYGQSVFALNKKMSVIELADSAIYESEKLFNDYCIFNEDSNNKKSIKDILIGIWDKIIEAISRVKDFLVKKFNKVFIKKAKEEADKAEENIKEKQSGVSTKDVMDTLDKLAEEISKFNYQLNQNPYVMVKSDVFFKEDATNLQKCINDLEALLIKNMKNYKFDFSKDEDMRGNINGEDGYSTYDFSGLPLMVSDEILNKVHWGKDKNNDRHIETFDTADLIQQCKSIIENEITQVKGDKYFYTHFELQSGNVKLGKATAESFPKQYKKYCEYIESVNDKYNKYLDIMKDMVNKIRAVCLKMYNYDMKQGGDQILSKKPKNIFFGMQRVFQFNIEYINYLLSINMKGIKAGAILCGKLAGY